MFLKEWFKNIKRKWGKKSLSPESLDDRILDLSKIEMDRLVLNPVIYETADLISDTVRLNLIKFENKPIVLKLQVDEHVPSTLYGDKFGIKHILNNLLSHAVQYTERGRVTLSIAAEQDGDRDGITLLIKVQDTRNGITEATCTDEVDGMSVTRDLIKMMKGAISIEKLQGKGAEYTVRLPQGNTGSDGLGMEVVKNLRQFRLNKKSRIKYSPVNANPSPTAQSLHDGLLTAT
jgi:signal transduction histidine kinase